MTSALLTSPSEYTTNTDEYDSLALDVSGDLGVGETIASAECELRSAYARVDVTEAGFPSAAVPASPTVTQAFDARLLAPGHYEWIWNVTLNTGAIRSYRLLLKVENHD